MSFQFKQFSIQQNNTAMKVGTDAVLLGAWSSVSQGNILDVGSGTGLIALMLAQRTNKAIIDAIEIEKEAYQQSKENIVASPWSNRITAHHTSVQHYYPEKKYDLIISNPPFFKDSTKAPKWERNTARHTDHLSFEDLIKATIRLLDPPGVFCLILPFEEGNEFIELAKTHGLFLNRKCNVKPNTTKPIKRVLLEFSFNENDLIQEELTIETKTRHQYTKDYISLTQDFYLNI